MLYKGNEVEEDRIWYRWGVNVLKMTFEHKPERWREGTSVASCVQGGF